MAVGLPPGTTWEATTIISELGFAGWPVALGRSWGSKSYSRSLLSWTARALGSSHLNAISADLNGPASSMACSPLSNEVPGLIGDLNHLPYFNSPQLEPMAVSTASGTPRS